MSTLIRKGESGTLSKEFQKIIWDKANDFEKRFQSWWNLVNFAYDPMQDSITAFVMTIAQASVCTIYPIIALGINHDGSVRYPTEHREWVYRETKKWQTVDISVCTVRAQQGFICKSNTIRAQDICLDTEQIVCDFEIHPNEKPETVLIYIGKSCVCMKTHCNFIVINDTVDTRTHVNPCICNFTKITGVILHILYLSPHII